MTSFEEKVEAGGVKPPATATASGVGETVQVWDPLVRLFHWALVIAFAIAWFSGDELERLHETAGYVIVGLLAFRVVWGFVGTAHARFADFLHRPSTVIHFLVDTVRFRAKRHLGHNPAGGAMVIAFLFVLGVITGTGIMMTTDTYWGVEWVEEAHEFAANLAIVLVGLHLAGVFIASVEHRENLVKAMFTGRKRRD